MGPMTRRTLAVGVIVLSLVWVGLGAGANLPPRAELAVVDVPSGAPVAFTLAATDPNGDPLTYAILGGPHHGRLEGAAPRLTYVPDRGFVGSDKITFAVTDPYGAFDVGMVRLRVTSEVTTHRIGPPDMTAEAGLASLAGYLASQQVRVWFIFLGRTAAFANGQEIPVLLPPGGEVRWVGLSPTGAEGARLVPIASEWDPAGWLRVPTQAVAPGPYILTVVKDHQAFSFLVVLKSSPHPGTQLAVGERRAEQGG